MAPSRLTREQVLERQVAIASATFVALFTAASRALKPYAVAMPVAFAQTDVGTFAITPQHVSVGASRAAAARVTLAPPRRSVPLARRAGRSARATRAVPSTLPSNAAGRVFRARAVQPRAS